MKQIILILTISWFIVNWGFSQQKDIKRGVKSAKNNETMNDIKKGIYVFLFDGYSDWEISYLTPEINKSEKFKLVYFSENGNVVTSMGGLQVKPTTSLDKLKFE